MTSKLETIKMSTTAIISFSITTGCAMLMSMVESSAYLSETIKIIIAFIFSFVYIGLYLTTLAGTISLFDKFIIKKKMVPVTEKTV